MFSKQARFLVGSSVCVALVLGAAGGCSRAQVSEVKAKELAHTRFEQLAAASGRGVADFELTGVTHENGQRVFRWREKTNQSRELVVVVFDEGGVAEGISK
jgi:hypothetical protein